MIKFKHNGKVYEGRVLSRDSDPTCAVWVVFACNPDRDAMVMPCDIIED